MPLSKRETGFKYENIAVEFLKDKGYIIEETNFFCKSGEIDIIAKENKYLVFIEVKYRSNKTNGTPQEAVNYSKQKKICKSARYYCVKKYNTVDIACRFDVVAITDDHIELIKDAFEYIV